MMTKTDRELGMDRHITRRDFLNGVSVAVGSTLLRPEAAEAAEAAGLTQQPATSGGSPESYPPARTGLRGSHPGSFEVAHSMRDGKSFDTGEDTGETYDLIVVGGGLSGLAAAYYFRKKTVPNAKILILDNHDDFGGHAKRNEFRVGGRLLIAKGGTSYIERPATFTAEGRDLLREIGIDYYEPTAKIDRDFYRSIGLRPSTYFDKETFGVDRLVVNDTDAARRPRTTATNGGNGNGGQQTPPPPSDRGPSPEFLAKTPLAEQVQKDLLRLWSDQRDYLTGLSKEEKARKLMKMSYKDYLLNVVKVHPDLLKYYHPGGQPSALTIETTSAWWSFNWGLPGFDGLGLEKAIDAQDNLDKHRPDQKEPTQFHFPEGNAGVARLLVRTLIPDALPGKTMVSGELERVAYDKLDRPSSSTRIRLNSTVVRVRNQGGLTLTSTNGGDANPATATGVEVAYVRDGKALRVRGKGCVLACYHAVIPYLCPDLPASQKEALHLSVRAVMMTTNIAVRSWKAFEKLGVSNVSSPGTSYPGYASASLNTPISMGGYKPPRSSDEPIVLSVAGGVEFKSGVNARDMFRAARNAMYQTSFEAYERKIRTHLARVLGDGGFDPAADIAAITINRWPHGYAMGQNLLFDPDWSEEEMPFVRARKRFGRITIANSDAEGVCLTQAAFDHAHRAVDELLPRYVAWWNRI